MNMRRPQRRSRFTQSALAAGIAIPAMTVGIPMAAAQADVATPADDDMRFCTSEDFKIIENEREAAAGTTYIEFAMLRIGGEGDANAPRQEPCIMHHGLDVYWIDEFEGDRVGAWAEYDGEPGEPFVLEPEETALLTLAQPNYQNYDPDVCDPAEVAGIQVQLDLGDGGTYASTGGQDIVCANPEVAVPRFSVAESPY
ncbi:MAG: hypothetical protein M0026_07375 [Nocardiopsaceae bacterium]|nr:hypothetical protein [Nocardiopsaceae bacterium]